MTSHDWKPRTVDYVRADGSKMPRTVWVCSHCQDVAESDPMSLLQAANEDSRRGRMVALVLAGKVARLRDCPGVR